MNRPTCCDHNHTVEDVQSLQCLNYTKEWSPSDEALFSTYFKGSFDSVDIYLKNVHRKWGLVHPVTKLSYHQSCFSIDVSWLTLRFIGHFGLVQPKSHWSNNARVHFMKTNVRHQQPSRIIAFFMAGGGDILTSHQKWIGKNNVSAIQNVHTVTGTGSKVFVCFAWEI